MPADAPGTATADGPRPSSGSAATSASPTTPPCWRPRAPTATTGPGPRGVVPLFVVDPALWGPSGDPRRAWLLRSLHALDDAIGGGLVVRQGDPVDGRAAGGAGGGRGRGPRQRRRRALRPAPGRGRRRGARARRRAPGRARARRTRSARAASSTARASRTRSSRRSPGPGSATAGPRPPRPPTARRGRSRWQRVPGREWPEEPDLGGTVLPPAGEAAAHETWREFLDGRVAGYAGARDLPGDRGDVVA